MRRILGALALMGLSVVSAAPAVAGDRADWGVVVAVGSEDYTLLVMNGKGLQLLAVDPFGDVERDGVGPATFSSIRPGDNIDYAVSTWAGMNIADFVSVATPRMNASAADSALPR